MIEPTESEPLSEIDRFCDAMIAIKGEIDRVAAGEVAHDDSALAHAPHTAEDLLVADWDRPYTARTPPTRWRPSAAASTGRPVSRIDGGYGDRNLVLRLPPARGVRGIRDCHVPAKRLARPCALVGALGDAAPRARPLGSPAMGSDVDRRPLSGPQRAGVLVQRSHSDRGPRRPVRDERGRLLRPLRRRHRCFVWNPIANLGALFLAVGHRRHGRRALASPRTRLPALARAGALIGWFGVVVTVADLAGDGSARWALRRARRWNPSRRRARRAPGTRCCSWRPVPRCSASAERSRTAPHGRRAAGQPLTMSAICSSSGRGPATSSEVMQVSRQASRSSRIFSGGPTR